jgi:hypothetical protein
VKSIVNAEALVILITLSVIVTVNPVTTALRAVWITVENEAVVVYTPCVTMTRLPFNRNVSLTPATIVLTELGIYP